MRRFFIIFAAFFVLQSVCAQSFKVNASVEGLPDGTVLTLTPLSHAKLAPIAEATVKNGKCVFEGTITQDVPLCVRMQVKDCLGRTTFMVDKNDDIQLSCSFTADGDNNGVPIYKISDPKVIGSPLTDEYYRISQEVEQGKKEFGQFRSFLGKRLSYMTEKRKEVKSREDNDSLMKNDPQFAKEVHMFNYMDSIMVLKMNSQTIASLFKYGDSFWGPLMMLDVWWYFTPRERPVFDLFSDEAKNCWYGRQVREELYPGGAVGEKVKPFTIKDEKGKEHSLASLSKDKKVVLLDFWASWCGPCRKEIPNVKRQYELYKDKGFEVISISIDKDEKAWQKALNEEQLPWPNFLDRNGVSDIYNVKSIPAMYLLRSDGTILATDMEARGEKLVAKLKELFK